MKEKITESDMLDRIYKIYSELGEEEFIEEFNRIYGTNYGIADVAWSK